jgi:hypothetical protein
MSTDDEGHALPAADGRGRGQLDVVVVDVPLRRLPVADVDRRALSPFGVEITRLPLTPTVVVDLLDAVR